MKSLKDAPARMLRWWGADAVEAFDFVSRAFVDLGFGGPRTWSEVPMVPFVAKRLCDTVLAWPAVSPFSPRHGRATFVGSVVLYSQTLHRLEAGAASAEPAGPKRRELHPGFRPCLTIPLAHLKWCSRPADENPIWWMSLEDVDGLPTVVDFVADFRSLMMPILDALKSDDDLEALLTRYLDRRKPAWVLSDNPTFARLPELVALLRTRRG